MGLSIADRRLPIERPERITKTKMATIRKAKLADLTAIARLVAYYAGQNILLPRSAGGSA